MKNNVNYGRQFGLWLVMFICITAVSIGASIFPLWVNLPFNVILPIIVLIALKPVMFERLKLTTLVLMRVFILVPAFHLMPGNLYVKVILVMLFINIMEATMTDLLKNKMYFNFVSGLFLAASVFFLAGEWTEGFAGPFSCIYNADVTRRGAGIFNANGYVTAATIAWVAAYTIWNWIFVIGEFSPSVGYLHVGILLSPIVSMLLSGNPGHWLIFRANSLTAGGVFQIGKKEYVEKTLENDKFASFVEKVKSRNVQIVLMIVNLALIGYTAFTYFA